MAQRLPPWKQMKRQEVNSESSDSNNVVNGGEFQQSNAVPSKSWKPTGNLMGSLNTSVNGESSEDGLPATAKTWKPSGSSSADQLSADRPQNSIFDSGERPPRIQVKVMNTPLSLTVDDLKSLFSPTGFIKHVKILPAREGRDSTLAFVQFNTQAEADAAIDQFNNFEVDGKTLRVMSDQKASNTGGSGFQGGFSSQNGESSARRPWGSGGHLNANGDGGSQDRFSGSDRVQVKVMNIPISLNKDDLESLFSPAGLVKQVKILPAREGRDSTLGYVHFTSQPEADAAIEQFNNFEVDGKTLRVMSADQKPSGGGSSDSQGGFSRGDSGGRRPWANPSGSTSGNDTMGSYDTSSRAPKPQTKVMGIPLTLTEDDIKALFSTAGFIKAVRILPVKEGRDSALGFIDWSTQEEVDAAVQQFNNYEIEGRTLRVFAVEPREERPPNPSGGGFSSGSIPWGNPVGNDGEQSRPWGNKVQGRLPRNAADQIDSRDSGNFNGGDTGKGCFKCGMEGHFARECPADMHCHQCGAPGHKSRECPEGGGGSRPAGGRRNFRNDDDGSLMNPGELDLQEGEERSLSTIIQYMTLGAQMNLK